MAEEQCNVFKRTQGINGPDKEIDYTFTLFLVDKFLMIFLFYAVLFSLFFGDLDVLFFIIYVLLYFDIISGSFLHN